MLINGKEYDVSNRTIISDIDDCMMLTTHSIVRHGLTPRAYYFDETLNNKHKKSVISKAEITQWGADLLNAIRNGALYMLLTSACNRTNLLTDKFNVGKLNILECMSDYEKELYLNNIQYPAIYIDDRPNVIERVKNKHVICVVI